MRIQAREHLGRELVVVVERAEDEGVLGQAVTQPLGRGATSRFRSLTW
jgi:hypothetical protein